MASKRPPLEIDALSENLRASTGRGMAAFFSTPTPSSQDDTDSNNRAAAKPVPQYRGTTVPGATKTSPGTPVPQYRGTAVPAPKRDIKRRHPFDVYRDQLTILKEFSMQEKKAGLLGSESAMVREALDLYIEKRRKNSQ